MTYTFSAELWVYDGDAPWHFVTLPTNITEEIRSFSTPQRGFGSLRVKATIGDSTWGTSIFPDTKSNSFVLPVKKEVRIKNNITAGDKLKVTVSLKEI